MIEDYLSLKRQGIKDNDIKKQLNISDDMLEFFPKFYPEFESQLSQIKKDLILKLLSENKSKSQVIEEAGITQKEYDDLIKYSKFKKNEFGMEYEKIVNERKELLLSYLSANDLSSSCNMANVTVDDFYQWLEDAKIDSEFYIKSNKILMDKYLNERKTGKTKSDACTSIALDESIVDKWLKRKNKLFDEFKDKNLNVIVNLVLQHFKNNKTKKEISESVEVSVNEINRFLLLGERGSKVYSILYDYYSSEVIPKQLSRFMDEIKNKPFNKAIDNVDLTKEELKYYYETNADFHDSYLSFKMGRYIEEILDGRTHEKSLKRSNLSDEEYLQLKEKIDEILLHERMEIVKREILNDSKSDVAAKRAGVTFDDVYDWYYKGKSDEEYREFSEFFYNHYMEPNIIHFNDVVNEGHPVDKILKLFDINFTQKDFEIWQEEGLIKKEDIVFNLDKDDSESDENTSLYDIHKSKLYKTDGRLVKNDAYNSKLYEVINEDADEDDISNREVLTQKNPSKSSSILKKDDEKDIEKLKKEILGKK